MSLSVTIRAYLNIYKTRVVYDKDGHVMKELKVTVFLMYEFFGVIWLK